MTGKQNDYELARKSKRKKAHSLGGTYTHVFGNLVRSRNYYYKDSLLAEAFSFASGIKNEIASASREL